MWLSHQSLRENNFCHIVFVCICHHGKVNGVCRVNIFLSSSFVEELSVCDTCDYEQLQTVMLAFSSCSFGLHPEKKPVLETVVYNTVNFSVTTGM